MSDANTPENPANTPKSSSLVNFKPLTPYVKPKVLAQTTPLNDKQLDSSENSEVMQSNTNVEPITPLPPVDLQPATPIKPENLNPKVIQTPPAPSRPFKAVTVTQIPEKFPIERSSRTPDELFAEPLSLEQLVTKQPNTKLPKKASKERQLEVENHRYKLVRRSILRISALAVIIFSALLVASLVYNFSQYQKVRKLESENIALSRQTIAPITSNNVESSQDEQIEADVIEFNTDEFVKLFDSQNLANTTPLSSKPEITSNKDVDEYIFFLAESQGYNLRPDANDLVIIDNNKLQPEVAKKWTEMQLEAKSEGINMRLLSGYRSIETQRNIFIEKSGINNFSFEDILAGIADEEIIAVLNESSPPGYSKHHTGYALDIEDSDQPGLENFRNSKSYTWLISDNFKNAKKFGFIPSYPDTENQNGPLPEPWEFVFVGTEKLLKSVETN